MSMCYWMIEGIGINVDSIIPHLNKRKLIKMLEEQLPDDEDVKQWKNRRDLNAFDIDDFLYGNPFQNLADLLTHCDDTDTITYGDNGDGGVYFYYPPSMPWHHKENEPQSVKEVHKRIIDAVMKVTDLTAKEIEPMISDDLYEYGCG